MLPKPHRLPSTLVRRIFSRGKRIIAGGICEITSLSTKEAVSRFLIIVPISISKQAVVRNRMKRLIRESIRHLIPTFSSLFDCIIVAKKPIVGKTQQEIENILKDHLTGLDR